MPIPKKLLTALGLQAGAEVSLDINNGQLVMAPRAYSFDQLLTEHKALKLDVDHQWRDFPSLQGEEA